MSDNQRFYYLNVEGKIIQHYAAKQEIEPQGFEFAGMSELPIRSAATFYVRGQQGYRLIDGDTLPTDPEPEPEIAPETVEDQPTQDAG